MINVSKNPEKYIKLDENDEFYHRLNELKNDRFVKISLEMKNVYSNELHCLARYLFWLNEDRKIVKGKEMSNDHLKQEAVKWIKTKRETDVKSSS